MRQRSNAASSMEFRTGKSYGDGSGVLLHIDVKAFDFHVDAAPHHTPSQVTAMLTWAACLGLEPLDPLEEEDAEILDDGTIRIWLTPTTPQYPWIAAATGRVDHALINHLEMMTS